MPRAKKTPAGLPGQPVQRVPNQTYGDAKDQVALQRQMPTPDLRTTTIPAPLANAPTQQSQPDQPTVNAPVQPQRSMQDVIAEISGRGGGLYAPDDRPQVPVTDGLRFGPGRGPEALRVESSIGRTLQQLANATRDPFFLELLTKVNR